MDYGTALKTLRRRKNVTQQQLAEGISSQANLSHFENTNSGLPIDILLTFLDRLNVHPTVYFMMTSNDSFKQKQTLIKSANEAMRNKKQLDHYRTLALVYYDQTHDYFYFAYAVRIAAVYAKLHHEDLAPLQDDLNKVKEYLLSLPALSNFEIALFIDLMFIFDHDFLTESHQRLLAAITESPLEEIIRQQYLGNYALNGATLAFERRKFDDLKLYSPLLEQISQHAQQLYLRLLSDIYARLFKLTHLSESLLIHEIWQRVDMLTTLGFKDGAQDVQALINDVLKTQ